MQCDKSKLNIITNEEKKISQFIYLQNEIIFSVNKLELIIGKHDAFMQFFNLVHHLASFYYPDIADKMDVNELQLYIKNKINELSFSESLKLSINEFPYSIQLIETISNVAEQFKKM